MNASSVIHDLNLIRAPYKKSGENISAKCIGINCPDCSDREFHMGIFVDRGNASCWRCGAKYSYKRIIVKLAEQSGISSAIVESILANTIAHVSSEPVERRPHILPPTSNSEASFSAIKLPYSFKYVSNESPDWVLEYIEERRLSVETCEEYDIGYCSHGKQKYRLVVPIFYKDLLVSYQGRDVTNQHPAKYLTAEGQVNRFVFGIDDLEGDTAIITEGVFDAIRVGPPAVCSFGIDLSASQIGLLLAHNIRKVVFMWDADAYLKARAAVKKIQPFMEAVKIVKLPYGADPDSLDKKESLQLISSSEWL